MNLFFLLLFILFGCTLNAAAAQQGPCPLRSGAPESWEGFCGNQQTLLGLPGLGVTLVHNGITTIPGYDGPGSSTRENLGYGLGWNVSLNAYIVRGRSPYTLTLVSGDGSPTNFVERQPGIWTSTRYPQDPRSIVSPRGGGYTVNSPDGSSVVFGASDTLGRVFVSSTSGLLGSRLEFSRGVGEQAGRINSISVNGNELLKFTYGGDTLMSVANLKDGPSASFGFGPNNTLVSVSAPDDVSWAIAYTPEGKIATLTGRSGVPIQYGYAESGAVETLTAGTQQISIAYGDSSLQVTTPAGVTSHEYTNGALTRIVEGQRIESRSYDSLNRLVKNSVVVAGETVSEVSFRYPVDGTGARFPLVTPALEQIVNGVKTAVTYNSDWFPTTITENGRTTKVDYQKTRGAVLISKVTSPTGVVNGFTYTDGALVGVSFGGIPVLKYEWSAGSPRRLVSSTDLVTGEVTTSEYDLWGDMKRLSADGRNTTFEPFSDPAVSHKGVRIVGPTGITLESLVSPLEKSAQNRLLKGGTQIASSSRIVDWVGEQVRTTSIDPTGQQSNLNLNFGSGGGSCLTGGGTGELGRNSVRSEACEVGVEGGCSAGASVEALQAERSIDPKTDGLKSF